MEKMKFNEEAYIEVFLNEEQLEISPFKRQEENKSYSEIIVKSK